MGQGQTADDGPQSDQVAPVGISRRQAMGRLTAVATAGAAAWVVPEILTAKPAAGAALSGTGSGGGSVGASGSVSTSASTGEPSTGASVGASGSAFTDGPDGVGTAAGTTATAGPSTLAFTGLNIERDAAVGGALVAGGWAMQHWASRTPRPAGSAPSVAATDD